MIDKTASANVKKLAEHLYKEHTEANQELAKLATLKGLTLPAEPDQEKKREIDKVAALTSAELDRTVLGKLAQSHRESIELFEREANEGSDHELKAFATKTLPTLREHLKMVEGTKSAAAGGGADRQRDEAVVLEGYLPDRTSRCLLKRPRGRKPAVTRAAGLRGWASLPDCVFPVIASSVFVEKHGSDLSAKGGKNGPHGMKLSFSMAALSVCFFFQYPAHGSVFCDER